METGAAVSSPPPVTEDETSPDVIGETSATAAVVAGAGAAAAAAAAPLSSLPSLLMKYSLLSLLSSILSPLCSLLSLFPPPLSSTLSPPPTHAAAADVEITAEGGILGLLLERLPDVFQREVLPLLDATDRAVMERVSRGMKAAVVSWGLPCVGMSEYSPFSVEAFFASKEMLAWAKVGRCRLTPG